MQAKTINMELDIAKLNEGYIVLELRNKNGEKFEYNTGKSVKKNEKQLEKFNTPILLEIMYESFCNTDEDDYKFICSKNSIIPSEKTLENIDYFVEDFMKKIK